LIDNAERHSIRSLGRHIANYTLTGVYVGVFLHVGLLMKSLAAELARVRAGVGVDQEVRGERRRALERLAALATLEAALGAVNGPVLAQAHGVAERLPTCPALVRASAAVVRPSPVNLRTHRHDLDPAAILRGGRSIASRTFTKQRNEVPLVIMGRLIFIPKLPLRLGEISTPSTWLILSQVKSSQVY